MLDESGTYANTIAVTYMFNGDYETAERYFEKYHSLSGDKLNYFDYDDLHMYSYVLRKNGKTKEAQLRLRQVEEYML